MGLFANGNIQGQLLWGRTRHLLAFRPLSSAKQLLEIHFKQKWCLRHDPRFIGALVKLPTFFLNSYDYCFL